MDKSKARKIKLGGACLLLFMLGTYFYFIMPKENATFITLTIFWAFFMVMMSVLCDEITVLVADKSLFHEIVKSRKNLFSFIAVSALGGILLEGAAQWLNKLWIYPYWNNFVYLISFILGFSLYWLMITESYLATKAILKRFTKLEHLKRSSPKEKIFFSFLGIIGTALATGGILRVIMQYGMRGGYVFDINKAVKFQPGVINIFLLFLGVWFILEYVEFSRKKSSLLKDILENYRLPLWAIVIASLGLATLMETINKVHGYWLYTNWPWESLSFFGLPASMYLAWPLHYIIFLSLFRAFTAKESEEIWK